MRIVIDATNLRDGGGVTHLTQILNCSIQSENSFEEIIVLGCKQTLSQIDDKPYIKKIHKNVFEKNYVIRVLWLWIKFDGFLKQQKADLLFAPGGSFFTSFHPVVTMSRNSLPLELSEARRYGLSLMYFRLLFLRYIQKRSFLKADGFIFLTSYAKETFIQQGWFKLKNQRHKISIIPHGVAPILIDRTGLISPSNNIISKHNPFEIIYVSIIDVYKHQDKVAIAIEKLNREGFFIEIHFVGPYYSPAFINFNSILGTMSDEIRHMVKYHGKLNAAHQSVLYSQMDCVLFASSCENMPNILLEGMSFGLPIICSNRGPMPEILKAAGEYFNPESIESICTAIKKLYNSVELRSSLAKESLHLSKNYSWQKCSNETFQFLTIFKR
jgi:glycosyltransferase involved in cell wall biosynthesis